MKKFTLLQIQCFWLLLLPTLDKKQDKKYHPEGSVWNHSFQSLYIALRETSDIDLILAAWFHDIGKTRISHGHEQKSVEIMLPYLSEKSLWLIDNHMRFQYWINGEMKKLSKVKELLNHPNFSQLAHLYRIDKAARKPNKNINTNPEEVLKALNKKIGLNNEY